jgi:predicted polyphosphate/ATP-dependent NAD kinase
MSSFRLGVVVNPWAGIGGATALKGSDGLAVRSEALARGAEPRAPGRMTRTLTGLAPEGLTVLTWAGAMGEDAATAAGLASTILGAAEGESTGADTQRAVRALVEAGIDLLLFAGGDGTARDVASALEDLRDPPLVLGVPAGVKMHSGVFAVTPEGAAEVITGLRSGALITRCEGEVRDIDEAAFREGVVKTRFYGALAVPGAPRWVQATKISGREQEPLVLEEIAADIAARMDRSGDTLWVLGPGSTTAAIAAHLGAEKTLLGVDVFQHGACIAEDVTAEALLALCEGKTVALVVTAISGQGHIFGRGNQQLSPAFLRRLAPDQWHIVATRSKLLTLEGRPLQVDTGDPALDRALSGYRPVITGFEDEVVYAVGAG